MKNLKQMVNEAFNSEFVNEAKEFKTEEEFKEYAETVLKNAHGDKFDAEVAKETIDSILKGADGNLGDAVGMLKSSLES